MLLAYCGGVRISHKGSVMAQNMMAPPTAEQKIMAVQLIRLNSGFSSRLPNFMFPQRLSA